MADCNLALTPTEPGLKLCKDDGEKKINNIFFKQIIGSLIYLTATRPDITYAVSLVSRYMKKPYEMQLNAAKRILHYGKGTIDYGVFYKDLMVLFFMVTQTVIMQVT